MGSQCKGTLQTYRVQSESLQSHLVPLAFPLLTITVFFPTLQIKGPQIKTCFCPTHESARLQFFPVLGGQGHDCVVLCKWLSVFLAGTSTTDMVTGSKFGIFLGMGLYSYCFLYIWLPGLGLDVPPNLLKDESSKMIFDLIKWGADSANGFYRALHSYGVWIPREDVLWISPLGWGVTDPGLHTS